VPDDNNGRPRPPKSQPNWTTIALIAGLALVLILVAYFATNRNSDQDKLTGNELSQAQTSDPEKRCASQATYDLIKSELFRRAADGGNMNAMFNLARLYETGTGVPKSRDDALKWFHAAADKGQKSAIAKLAELEGK